ncbi:MAG: hypothetical protein LBM07_00620 [Culturomica sp.]|jgi:tetratricopeptide (TPR) repeat protein|nr:hypothetical protein [Culturomica sp.]
MRKNLILTLGMILLIFGVSKAQTPQSGSLDVKFGLDSIQTITQASIYSEYFKHKNFDEALAGWRYVFNNAPKYSRNTYTRGATMMNYFYAKTKNEAYIDTLMMVYDKWIKYFSTDKNYGEGYAWGKKGYDLYRLKKGNVEAQKEAYSYLTKSFEMEGAKTTPITAITLFLDANELFKGGNLSREEYINLYSKLSAFAETGEKNAKPADKKEYQDIADNINVTFFNSGAADCEILDKLLTVKFKENINNLDELKSILKLLNRGDCGHLQLTTDVIEAVYKLEPSAEAAFKLAETFIQKKDYAKAEKYLREAVEKEQDNVKKADYYIFFARLKLAENNLRDAKQFANEALKFNPKLGEAYLIIGQAYAAYAKEYGSDDFEHQTVYWVVVDKFQKAKQVNPALAEKVNSLIASYSPHFPSKEEAFFRGIKEGDSYTVGSWIGETTKVRFR